MESTSQSKPVMDVKAPAKPVAAVALTPPRPAEVNAASPAAVEPGVPQQAPASAAKPPLPPGPTGIGSKQSGPLPLHKAPEEEQSSGKSQAVTQPEVSKAQPKTKNQKTSQGVTVAIVLTLVAMIALSTLAVYMYTQS